MDFVSGLPLTSYCSNDTCVVVDRLTKIAHFLHIQMSFSAERFTHIYVRKVVYHHGVRISIISERGSVFTFRFWRNFQLYLGTQVNLRITFQLSVGGDYLGS